MSELLTPIRINQLPEGIPENNDLFPFLDTATNTVRKGLKGSIKGDSASVDVVKTSTGVAGSSAMVKNTGTSQNALLEFTIPRGAKGVDGVDGANGVDGKGWTGGSYNNSTGKVTFTSDDGLGFVTDDLRGKDGEDGADGTNGIDGNSFYWKGSYNSGIEYKEGEAVEYNGSSYMAKGTTQGNLPTNTTYWDLMAQKGLDGLGSGDMLKSVYDPNEKEADAFDMDNMTEGTTNKLVSGVEKTGWNSKLDDISGESIGDLSDVDDTNKANGKVLKYNSTSKNWEAQDEVTYQSSDFDIKDLTDSTNLKTTWNEKMVNPMTAKGDIIIGDTNGTPTKLVKDTDGKVLKLVSGSPAWASEQDISGKIDKSNLTAKGTLISASGASTPSALTVGTNGQLLSADSTQANGLKWVNAPSVPSKASSSDINTGTDDDKYITSKGLADSDYIKESDIRNSQSIVSNSSITPTGDYKENEVFITALAVATTINAPSGTPVNGNTLLFRIKDNGTKKDLTWNSIYSWIGVDKPTETTAGKVMYIGAIYNSTSGKWEVIALSEE